MTTIQTQPARGTRDFLPSAVKSRKKVFSIIEKSFARHGFEPIDTPALERIEVLTGKYGEEGEMLMYKIAKRGEESTSGESDLALRYDLTIPFARYIAEYQHELPSIFRRSHIAPVWRAERPGKGRLREFYQCDIDIAGGIFPMADAEVITTLASTLSELGLSGFVVNINSRKVLKGMVEVYGIPIEKQRDFFIGMDKLDKVGVSGVIAELTNRNIPRPSLELLERDLHGSAEELRNHLESSQLAGEGLDEVDTLISLLTPILGNDRLSFNPFLARGLDYYTGPIFEIIHPDFGSSLAGGGRYDSLIGMFSNRDIPTCGGSLGIERILLLLNNQEDNSDEAPVLITVWDDSLRPLSLSLASTLRQANLSAEIYTGSGNLGKQLQYAARKGNKICVICGPDEAARNEVTVKYLERGEQVTINSHDLITEIRRYESGNRC